MAKQAQCKHGCGTTVSAYEKTCPNCGGADPHPESGATGGAGPIEKGCLIAMIVGGLIAGIALIVTKLIVG